MVTVGAPILSFGRECVLDVGRVPTGGSRPRRHLLKSRFHRVERALPTGRCLSLHPVLCLPARVPMSSTVRRHVNCARRLCDTGGNVRVGARETSRSVRRSCRNVRFGAPIRSGCVCDHRRHGGGTRLYSHLERGTGRPDEGRGGGWRSERDVVGAANLTLGATNVTAYTMPLVLEPRMVPRCEGRWSYDSTTIAP